VTNATRQQKLRDERKKQKQKRVEVWVHVDDEPAIRALAVVLNRKRRDER